MLYELAKDDFDKLNEFYESVLRISNENFNYYYKIIWSDKDESNVLIDRHNCGYSAYSHPHTTDLKIIKGSNRIVLQNSNSLKVLFLILLDSFQFLLLALRFARSMMNSDFDLRDLSDFYLHSSFGIVWFLEH